VPTQAPRPRDTEGTDESEETEHPHPLNIKNEEAHRLVQALAEETGETLTEAVMVAVRERLESLRPKQRRQEVAQSVRDPQEFVRGLPDLDRRSPEEILGYDDFGLPR
jgi:antitoxin VapB